MDFRYDLFSRLSQSKEIERGRERTRHIKFLFLTFFVIYGVRNKRAPLLPTQQFLSTSNLSVGLHWVFRYLNEFGYSQQARCVTSPVKRNLPRFFPWLLSFTIVFSWKRRECYTFINERSNFYRAADNRREWLKSSADNCVSSEHSNEENIRFCCNYINATTIVK